MPDNLNIYGQIYPDAAGIKAKDTNGNTLTFYRPQGTKSITENGQGIDVASYASVNVNVPSSSGTYQQKTVNPTEQQQAITPDTGYDALSQVTVNGISNTYVGSGITRRSSSDLTTSGATVSVPSGYYESNASGTIQSGTEGSPTATKGTVSNNSMTVTPSVTNTAGYISGGTHSGTSVTVTASELVSGSATFTDDGTYDVTNYESAEVAIDYVAKTVPVTFINHTGTVTSVYRSTLNSTVISTSTGYITNGASTIIRANSTVIAHFPAGFLNFVIQRKASAGNFEIQVDGSVVTPAIEWAYKKMYSFGSSDNPVTGWTIDIYDSSDPWPELVSAVPLSVNANGTYSAPSGTAYTPVTVAVPNTYEATDEGKVVSNGALVAQSSDTVTQNNTYDTTLINSLTVNVPTGGQINNQNKSVNPTESQQSITYDNGYTGLGTVTVSAISSDYVGSNVARNTAGDISNPSTQHVSIPAGFYENPVDYLFPVQTSGAKPEIDFNAGTGVITPKFVLNEETEGYYYGTITGNPVQLPTASASTYTPTESEQTILGVGTYITGSIKIAAISSTYVGSNIARKSSADLTASGSVVTAPAGYYSASASKAVAAGSVAVPNKTITANPTISVSAAGVITASVAGSSNVSPTVTAGYVTSGTQGTMSVSGSSTFSLTTQAAATITPSESQQTAVASQRYTTGNVVVAAISADYVGSSVTRRSSADLTASSSTITAPAGYYASAASKTVSAGTAGTPTATKGTVSNHSVSITPSVTNTTGWITGGTKTGTAVTVSASELASGTYTFTNSGTINVTNYASAVVSAGTAGTPTATKGTVSNHSVSITPSVTNTTGWITGSTKTGTAVTVNASELVSGSSAISSNGTYDVTNYASAVVSINYVTYYTGRDAPSSALGQDGDIYLQL